MRSVFAIAFVLLIASPGRSTAAPDFAPNPRQAFEGFVGINPPRADVPVGALWINGYGPAGEGASADNLETVRSLNGVSIDKALQLSLSIGILQLFGIDPKARGHYAAHFADLQLVRVKDLSRLSGVKGEPRIVEALKAGSVTISSDSDIGLGGQSLGYQQEVQGSGTSDRTRAYSIEAHDMFIAIHVATSELTGGKEREVTLNESATVGRLDDFVLVIARDCSRKGQSCPTRFSITKLNTQTAPASGEATLGADQQARLRLPVSISDHHGGLFDGLVLRWMPACSEYQRPGCPREPRLFGHYEGARVRDLESVHAPRW